MSNMKHTPTPWRRSTGSSRWIVQEKGGCIACVEESRETGDANAAFIVRACNAHEQLVDGLKAALENGDSGDWQSARRAINEALAAAEA